MSEGGPLRVLFLSAEYPPETGWGGIGSSIAAVALGLVGRGHEVHVLSCVEGQAARDSTDGGVIVHRRGLRRLPRVPRVIGWQTAQRLRAAWSTSLEARRLLPGADIVESPDWGAEGLLFALRGRAPVIVHLHTPLPLIRRWNGLAMHRDARWAAALERWTIRRAHAVTAPSRFIADEVARLGWLGGRRVEVIPNAVDRALWARCADVRDTAATVLFVGRLEARKAPEALVDAARTLGGAIKDVRAVFVGRSSGTREGRPYRDWLLARPGADRCVFVGEVPRHELPALIAAARVVALPSHFDNFPMAVAEAMAAGRPVVVSSATGCAAMIEAHGAGAVVPPGDGAALAAALHPFLADAGHAAVVGERGRRVAADELDPAVIAGRRETVYAAAIGARRR